MPAEWKTPPRFALGDNIKDISTVFGRVYTTTAISLGGVSAMTTFIEVPRRPDGTAVDDPSEARQMLRAAGVYDEPVRIWGHSGLYTMVSRPTPAETTPDDLGELPVPRRYLALLYGVCNRAFGVPALMDALNDDEISALIVVSHASLLHPKAVAE